MDDEKVLKKYGWLGAIALCIGASIMYYANASSERRLVVVDENGASGDFKKFYLAEPFQEGTVVLKNSKEAKEYRCFEVEYRLYKGKVVSFRCVNASVDDEVGARHETAALSVKYEGAADSVLQSLGYTMELDTGFTYPYPAFDKRDSLWVELNSGKEPKGAGWNRYMIRVDNIDSYVPSKEADEDYVWLKSVVVKPEELNSLVKSKMNFMMFNVEKIYKALLAVHHGFETELVASVEFDSAQKIWTTKILSSTTPYLLFEDAVLRSLKTDLLPLGREKSFRILLKIDFHKTVYSRNSQILVGNNKKSNWLQVI